MSSGRLMGPQAVSSVTQSCLTLCNPMDRTMPGTSISVSYTPNWAIKRPAVQKQRPAPNRKETHH